MAWSIVSIAYGLTLFVPYYSSLAILLVIAMLLFGVWLLLVGSRLYKLGKR
jgi:hypothetical protein